jgi:hypothetical protein
VTREEAFRTLRRQGYTSTSIAHAVRMNDMSLLRRAPEDDEGGAGVREPRRPVKPQPAGAAMPPEGKELDAVRR